MDTKLLTKIFHFLFIIVFFEKGKNGVNSVSKMMIIRQKRVINGRRVSLFFDGNINI